MNTRKDVHRPSVINPADYAFVGFEFLPTTGDTLGDLAFIRFERENIRHHMESTGGTYSHHQHGGNCHVCGSVNAIYTAIFHHKPSNSYIRTGLDCTDKLDSSVDGETFRRNVGDARLNAAGKAKAKAILADKGLNAAWEVYTGNCSGYEETTIKDIVGKLVQYGSISDKQIAFIGALVNKIANRAAIQAQRSIEHSNAKPVPMTGDRIMVTGTVVSIKEDTEGAFPGTRILVQHVDGWKVYGTLPSSISNVTRGQTVEFKATIKRSNKDEKFGFFSRPTNARIVL